MALKGEFGLPLRTIGRSDAMKLKRELLAVEEYISQSELREPGTPLKHLPTASLSLNDFAEINHVNLLNRGDRSSAVSFLDELLKNAPEVHISFASDPSSTFLRKITGWFRNNIDPLILVNIGLEPSIAAGCTLRTANHYYDFSLRENFTAHRDLLIKGLKEPLV